MDTLTLNSDQVEKIRKYVEEEFDKNELQALQDFIRIPNLSKGFDPEWETNGKIEEACTFLHKWVTAQGLKNTKAEIIREKGRTPLLFIDVEGSTPGCETILMYGHYDKQPWFTGWREGLGPITPVIEGRKLYGRGSSDDGYACFGAVLSIKALQKHDLPHPRCVILIEGDEESEGVDLEFYFDLMRDRIGNPKIIFCLDSGCGDYEHLYLTTTLRGVLGATINVKILTEGVHSGDASGVVPDTFRILRLLLDRIEDPKTGQVHRDFHVNIPGDRYKQAEDIAKVLGSVYQEKFPYVKEGVQCADSDPFVTYLNRIWRPQLSCIGIDGLPPTSKAGNVLRPETNLRISIRLPPTLDEKKALETLQKIILSDPPYGAEVTLTNLDAWKGWNAPPNEKYFDESIERAALNFFGKKMLSFGEGGSIPFIEFLNQKYPNAQFFVSGVGGPGSNAHGPNENLDIPYTKQFICCISQVLTESYPHLAKKQ